MKTVIAQTAKGHRVWLQGMNDKYGWPVGAPYSVTYTDDTIILKLDVDNGKRKVSKGKGGIIDLVGKRVTQWARGSESAMVFVNAQHTQLVITRS